MLEKINPELDKVLEHLDRISNKVLECSENKNLNTAEKNLLYISIDTAGQRLAKAHDKAQAQVSDECKSQWKETFQSVGW
jgi:hypothetical protein